MGPPLEGPRREAENRTVGAGSEGGALGTKRPACHLTSQAPQYFSYPERRFRRAVSDGGFGGFGGEGGTRQGARTSLQPSMGGRDLRECRARSPIEACNRRATRAHAHEEQMHGSVPDMLCGHAGRDGEGDRREVGAERASSWELSLDSSPSRRKSSKSSTCGPGTRIAGRMILQSTMRFVGSV